MGVAHRTLKPWRLVVDADLDTLATALYVTVDDFLIHNPQHRPVAPKSRDQPAAVGCRTGHPGGGAGAARVHLRGPLAALRRYPTAWFVSLPANAIGLQQTRPRSRRQCCARCARTWSPTPAAASDDVWVVDSTPVECGRSRETAKRSALAGWAEYGYCASHSRYFWGLRLHLLCTVSGAAGGVRAHRRQGR